MKWLALLFLSAACFAQVQANVVVVGNPAHPMQFQTSPSIQTSINQAGPDGMVWIPANYTGGDCKPVSSCNPGNLLVFDLRNGSFAPSSISGVGTGTVTSVN